MEFIETNHRNPSKYRAEERNYYNFVKMCGRVAECGEVDGGEVLVVRAVITSFQ